jgi:hypothetical protein
MLTMVAALALVASACSIDIERNADGSLQVVGEVTAESMATEFERDPENDSVEVTIDDGVMWLDIEGTDENGEYIANLRVELGVVDGAPAVDITEAFYNGWTVPDDITDEFNKAIEKEIRKAVQQNRDARLISLTADDGTIVTEWRVDTQDSKSR